MLTRTQTAKEDTNVDGGAKVVHVRDEDELFTLFDELPEQTGIVEALVDVTVARRVPSAWDTHNKCINISYVLDKRCIESSVDIRHSLE